MGTTKPPLMFVWQATAESVVLVTAEKAKRLRDNGEAVWPATPEDLARIAKESAKKSAKKSAKGRSRKPRRPRRRKSQGDC